MQFTRAPHRGMTRMNVLALILCVLSFGAMVAAGLHYLNKKKEAQIAINQHEKDAAGKLLFWEPVQFSPIEMNEMGNQALQSFFIYMQRAVTVSEKAAHVSNGFAHIGKMNTYYANHPFEVLFREPKVTKINMLNVKGAPCLMLVVEFKNESKWELDFFKDDTDGRWKLDWPAFVRYQPVSWDSFINSLTPLPQGAEFRVWALREKPEEIDPEYYAIRFIGPNVNGIKKAGISSPIVNVPKSSDIGKELYKYLKINELMNPKLKILNADDDPNYIRLRAVISKHADENDSSKMVFKLDKIISEGWYDDPPSK